MTGLVSSFALAGYCSVETQCIAAAGARREHAAGKRLRETMEKHHMRATSAEM